MQIRSNESGQKIVRKEVKRMGREDDLSIAFYNVQIKSEKYEQCEQIT